MKRVQASHAKVAKSRLDPITSTPDEQDRYRDAESMLAQGKIHEATVALNELAHAGSNCWQVYNDLGALAFANKEYASAGRYLEKAVALEPGPGLACGNLAAWHKAMGNVSATLSLLGRMLASDPGNAIAKDSLRELLLMSDPTVLAKASCGLGARYEERAPSPQTIVDLFGDSWKSRLPGETSSGKSDMFADGRPAWLASKLAGGLHFKSVLELGPFEGYQTYLLDRLGAREIVSVEANTVNFLKCLCLKELYGLKAQFMLGDVIGYMSACARRFDAVFASGVLYHMQDPVRFIELAARLAPSFYIWTHIFDERVLRLTNGQERHFVPEHDQQLTIAGRVVVLHARSYLIAAYRESIPRYWEGRQGDLTYWLSKPDLLWLLRQAGLDEIDLHDESEVNGLPCISLLARRTA